LSTPNFSYDCEDNDIKNNAYGTQYSALQSMDHGWMMDPIHAQL